jgi:hypothetical protein
MLQYALAAIDILAGIAILGQTYFGWSPIVWIGIAILIKGIYSLATSAAAQFYFDALGWADVAAAVIIFLGLAIPWFFIIPIAKGIYSAVMIRL